MLNQMLSLIALLSISIVYLVFDLFNDRSIPDLAVYPIFMISLVVSLDHYNLIGIALCSITLLAGYVIYKKGFIGLGDIYEISSVFLLSSILFDIRFISDMVYMNAIMIDIYYLFMFHKNKIRVNFKFSYSSITIMALFVIIFILNLNPVYLPLLVSVMILLLIKPDLDKFMVKYIDVNNLKTGDIIATHYELGSENSGGKKLIDKEYLDYLKSNHINSVPIYANAFPFTITIFVSVLLSILIGNVLIY